MTKPVLTEPEADQELEDAAGWYEEQRAGLGERFLTAVDATVARITRFPQAGNPAPFVPPGISAQRVPVRSFPYHVVYLDTPAAIRILAIAHDRRRPGYWLSRHWP